MRGQGRARLYPEAFATTATDMKYDRISDTGCAGIFAAPRLIGPLRTAARRGGLVWYDLDLRGVRDREAFFDRCREVFGLPGWFGGNWDAWHESLRDLAAPGARGAVVHWRGGRDFARRSPESVRTALEILQDAAMYKTREGYVFIVVVERSSAPGVKLGALH